jgi:hypothetical protein
MAKFVQLNLDKKSGDSGSAGQGGGSTSKNRAAIFSVLLMLPLVSGVLLLGTNGCSKGTKNSAATNLSPSSENQNPTTQGPTLAAPASTSKAAESKPPVRKKSAKRRASTVTYKDPTYGVSFRYPKNYILKTGDEPHLDLAGLGPVQMNFVQPGGTTLAAVEMPRDAYPGADISSAFFSVNVNSNLTSMECSQFGSTDESDPVEPLSASKVKVGAFEFDETEDTLKQSDAKYYHVFQDGTCYEFGLGMGTPQDGGMGAVTEAAYEHVFDKLEKILTTVKIQPGVVPEVAGRAQVRPENESKN